MLTFIFFLSAVLGLVVFVLIFMPPLSVGKHLINAIVGGFIGIFFYLPITNGIVLPIAKVLSTITHAFEYWEGTGLGESLIWPLFLIYPFLIIFALSSLGGSIANRSKFPLLLGAAIGGTVGSFILSMLIYFTFAAGWGG